MSDANRSTRKVGFHL